MEYKYFVKNEDGTVADWPDFVNQVSLRPEIDSLNIHDKWVGLLRTAMKEAVEDAIEEKMEERMEDMKDRMEDVKERMGEREGVKARD